MSNNPTTKQPPDTREHFMARPLEDLRSYGELRVVTDNILRGNKVTTIGMAYDRYMNDSVRALKGFGKVCYKDLGRGLEMASQWFMGESCFPAYKAYPITTKDANSIELKKASREIIETICSKDAEDLAKARIKIELLEKTIDCLLAYVDEIKKGSDVR